MEVDTREIERRVLDKVGCAISQIDDSKSVDEVIAALHSVEVFIFPHQQCCVNEQYRDKLGDAEVTSEDEKTRCRDVFYRGNAFRTFSKVLLYDIACNWLASFPASARKNVYDVFFSRGRANEIVQVLVPCLQCSRSSVHDHLAVCMNAERLIELCFLKNDMVCQMATEVAHIPKDLNSEQLNQTISTVTQLVSSIPDKVRRGASSSLSAHLFYKAVSSQLLRALEQLDLMSVVSDVGIGISTFNATFFTGQMFARICRRGSADVVLSEVIPWILKKVRSIVISRSDLDVKEILESKHGVRIWLNVMEGINDSHSLQRIAEEALNQLVIQNANDDEAYWVLWVLFGRLYDHHISVRSMFLEKFLLWKVFPICCLRWILHFAVFQSSPDCFTSEHLKSSFLRETVQRLVAVWSTKEFLQSSSTEQQVYVTAALGLCLEKMTKEDLDAAKNALHCILQGISCRLESPTYLIRKMASTVAFVFSKIVTPENPLYLDDTCQHEAVDWEFGLSATTKGFHPSAKNQRNGKFGEKETLSAPTARKLVTAKEYDISPGTMKGKRQLASKITVLDEVIDPESTELNKGSRFDEMGSDSEDSEASSDSLQPYDLTDHGDDLKNKTLKLVDLVTALRKSDDHEAVENALDVAEKLIRASPDELKYIAHDLVRSLVYARCSDIAADGEEESAEEKRQKALVALIVTCPLESLDCLNKMLYSSTLDISQRILILDVMTEAAPELATSRIVTSEQRPKPLISSYSSRNPWFIPSDIGPPGTGPWKEISSGNLVNWTHSYERELPLKSSYSTASKTRQQSSQSTTGSKSVKFQNCFVQYAAAFMLPSMQGFDKKRQGVDLLGRDFIVLAKLVHMLGVCMRCAAMHPEAWVLSLPLLNMLQCREISRHAEAHVRKAVLFTASSILSALHPSYVASALAEGNIEISQGLDWVRTYALQIADSEIDRECHTLAMVCLQAHSEMALQASRSFESSREDVSLTKTITFSPSIISSRSIKIPHLNL